MRRHANGGRGGAWPRFPSHPPPPQPPPPFAPPPHFHPQPPPPPQSVRADVNAFVEALRSSHSQLSAPPNALSVPTALRAICAHFQVASVEELLGGVAPLQLPALRQLNALNQRVWTFVTCFVHTRRVNTLFECFQAFLAHEGVAHFHDLRIGNSFVHTEAVQKLYHAPTAMLNVSTRDILTHLRQFEALLGHDAFRHTSHIDRSQFLQYLAQQYRQPNVETLGIAVDAAGFGAYIALLRRLSVQERKELKTIEDEFQKGIADKVFEVTKDKFSAKNRQQALDDVLLASTSSSEQATAKRPASSTSLSLEMLKRVTDIDVFLDNVLRRKAAADARVSTSTNPNPNPNRKPPISSQEIAETDVKIRNQLTRFLVATQKSKHHSRIKVVTWVLCGVMAKIHTLLLHDDKLPEEKAARAEADDDNDDDSGENATKATKRTRQREDATGDSDDDRDECDCCCVGIDTCKCACDCECHAASSGEDEGATGKALKAAASKPPTTTPSARVVDMDVVKRDVAQYLTTYCERNAIDSFEQLLTCFISLEIHLQHDRSGRLDRSALELVLDLWNDDAVDRDQAWYQAFDRLVTSLRCPSNSTSGSAATDRAEVTTFLQQCYATLSGASSSAQLPKSEMRQLLAMRTHIEFGLDAVEQLGGVEAIAALAEEAMERPSASDRGIATYANALVSAGDLLSDASADAPGESLRALRVEEAIDALRQSPFLVDVAQWTQWQQRFAPSCGPLRAFVRTHEMILLDHASLLFVFGWNGVVRRVDDASTPSALELMIASATRDSEACPPPAADVAVHLVSMLVKCGGQQNYPTQLLQAHLRTLFAAIASKRTEADDVAPVDRYVLDLLLVVPLEFAGFVYSVVADAAVLSTGDTRDRMADRVWSACRNDVERRALAAMADSCNNNNATTWADKFRSSTAISQTATVTVVATDRVSPVVDDEPNNVVASPVVTGPSSFETIADRFARVSEEETQQHHEDQQDQHADSQTTTPTIAQHPESCRAWIDQIRREQFGIGLAVQDEATAAVLAIQQQRLERALKRLSDELYSENTHFVLELLQNADDNEYESGVRAKGEFTLTSDQRVVFHNNERGFSRANVRAICDVGASTKAVSSSASIGKKGIGFKSVFKIADSPEVHSNGFHLRFYAATSDAHDGGGLGYILPFWIDKEAEWQRQRGTTFVLPLNRASVQRVGEISTSLLAFEPSVLLFLRRIQELRISDHVQNQQLHFLKETKATTTRSSSSYEIVQLFSQISHGRERGTAHAQDWLVVKKRLVAPAALVSASDGRVSGDTELAIALPLAAGADDSGGRAPLQQVFAYLPLRSYGFRFVIQGDFEVPSSREAIVNGSEWNQWLISQLPALLAHAVTCFVDELQTSHAGSDDSRVLLLPRMAHLLALLPFESEIQAPFRSVVRDALREVSQTPFLPIESGSGGLSLSLELRKPVELLDAWEAVQDDDVLHALVRDEPLVAATLQKKLLLFALSKTLTVQQKALLRVETLKAAHVLQLLAHAPARNDTAWVLGMFRVLSRLWKRDRHAGLLLQELRLIKCFPLENAESKPTWVSLADVGDALFLASAGDGSESGHRSSRANSFYGDLNVLRSDFSVAVAVASLADVRTFLTTHVELKTIEDHDLIAHHMLPQLARLDSASSAADDGADSSTTAALVRKFCTFIASHLARCSADCRVRSAVQSELRVWTCAEQVATAATPNVFVLLSSVANEMPALSTWLRERVRRNGREEGSGAFDVVALEPADDGGDTHGQQLLVDTLHFPLLFDVTDKRAVVAFERVLTWLEAEASADVKEKVSTELALHLNKHWPDPTTEIVTTTATAVARLLQSSKWLYGSDGRFHRPSKLWVATPALETLFPASVAPSSRVAWPNAHLATVVLRLKQTPTLGDALDALVRLARHRKSDSLEVSDVRRIYAFASEQAKRESPAAAQAIRQAFATHSLVFAPVRKDSGRGHAFFPIQDVVWSATAWGGHLVALEQSYPKTLRPFFTDLCGAARKPSVTSLCQRLTKLQGFVHASDAKQQWTRDVLPVLQFLAKQVRKAALPKPELRRLRKTLKATAWLPTVSAGSTNSSHVAWCTSQDAPVVCATDEELAVQKLVTGMRRKCGAQLDHNDSLQLVKLDPGLLDELQPLVKLAKLRALTAHAVTHASDWCDLVTDAASAVDATLAAATDATASNSGRKRVQKLLRWLVTRWSHAFALDRSMWTTTDERFQQNLQRRVLFPVLHEDAARFATAADVYVNDQAELSIDSFSGGLQVAFPILSLFPSSFFVNTAASGDAACVRDFLLAFCGMRSLDALLTWDVMVATGARQHASATLRAQVQQSLSVAQRFLFQQHRALYDAIPHTAIQQLAHDVQCVVVQDAGALCVTYRVGTAFGVRQAVPSCFLDRKTRVLYVVATASDSDDAWRGKLHDVLLEVSRKCFGAPLAASVANLLYLASLQPRAELLETWLVDSQQLRPLDSEDAGTLWVPSTLLVPLPSTQLSTKKRAFATLEDGEVEQEDEDVHDGKRLLLGHHGAVAGGGGGGMADQIVRTPTPMSKEERVAIGRWGEEYVFKQLLASHKDNADVTVEWVNEHDESGKPYDLTVSSRGRVVEYVEVKATRTMEKATFEISMNELDQAALHGSSYCIYRVFNAGNDALCRVVRMKNPVALVRQKKVQLALVMQ